MQRNLSAVFQPEGNQISPAGITFFQAVAGIHPPGQHLGPGSLFRKVLFQFPGIAQIVQRMGNAVAEGTGTDIGHGRFLLFSSVYHKRKVLSFKFL